jgi:hypothetical protein
LALYIYAVTGIMKSSNSLSIYSSLSCSPTKPTVEGENLTGDDGPQLRTV